MKSLSLGFVAVLLLAGCATGGRAPADVAHLELVPGDSPLVAVTRTWLQRKEGRLLLSGYVLRKFETKDTTGTHLDITILDAGGRVLRQSVEHFEPRQIPLRRRMPDSANFGIALDPLPAAAARIEVRAHEGPHP